MRKERRQSTSDRLEALKQGVDPSDARMKAMERMVEFFLFRECDVNARKMLAAGLSEEKFAQGEELFPMGSTGSKMYLIHLGFCDFDINGKVVSTMGPGTIFGELSLLYNVKRTAGARAKSDLTVWSLDKAMFDDVVKKMRFNRIEFTRKVITASPMTGQAGSESVGKDEQDTVLATLRDAAPTELAQLEPLGKVARGGFSWVSKVRNRDDNNLYALKCMAKKHIVERGLKAKVVAEKVALQSINSDFVLRLLRTYQDRNYIYMLTELTEGGDLLNYLGDGTPLDYNVCIFFSACLLNAVDHVHSSSYIHRDIKPENCLVCADGYLKLADFGLCKKLPTEMQAEDGTMVPVDLAFTMCGTPEFLAPEYLFNMGYNHSADWWAVGCLVAEMLIGINPFETDDLKKTFTHICSVGLGKARMTDLLPEELLDEHPLATQFLVDVLAPQDKRLGNGGADEMRAHDIYSKHDRGEGPVPFEWGELANRSMQSPVKVQIDVMDVVSDAIRARDADHTFFFEEDGADLPVYEAADDDGWSEAF